LVRRRADVVEAGEVTFFARRPARMPSLSIDVGGRPEREGSALPRQVCPGRPVGVLVGGLGSLYVEVPVDEPPAILPCDVEPAGSPGPFSGDPSSA